MTQVSAAEPRAASRRDLFDRNLAALEVFSPRTAARIRAAEPDHEVEFTPAPDGLLSGSRLGHALCSRRRPREEASELARSIPLEAAAGIVVVGFGLGHHIAALAERVKRMGLIVVFEPDIALLRAVLSHIDHTRTFLEARVAVLSDADDPAAITQAVSGCEGLLAMGVKVLHHPASRARLREAGETFARHFVRVFKAVRTNIVTTLAHAELTLRNQLQNIDRYVVHAGIDDLAGIAPGYPAVVVSAGPSLERNLHLLGTPGVRDRVVIIAVQTVLRTMLQAGIRPHFVTALDHHEISRRFYEGLTPAAVAGVTLVAEAKANPAILGAFPGAIRTPADAMLDRILAGAWSRAKGSIRPGATVAHMAYYLARHLGCDPVILVGQDLGFSDGQYYASGAAIHETWSSELNPFNSLEMMEWQRVIRSRQLLHRATDIHGQPIYTDEQMATYLVQFERDFLADAAAGRSILDATEGGLPKKHTTATTLASALAGAGRALPPLPAAPPPDPSTLPAVREHLARVRRDARRISEASDEALDLLRQMLESQRDQRRIGAWISEVYRIRDEVEGLQPAFDIVEQVNQTGTLNRARADRLIEIDPSLAPLERQRREIERDIVNVRWTGEAAAHVAGMLDDAIRTLDGGPRITRDPAPAEARSAASPARVIALIAPSISGALFRGAPAVEATLQRLARCNELAGAFLLAQGPPAPGSHTVPAAELESDLARLRDIRAARLFSPSSWRGGIAGLTAYDEAFAPLSTRRALRELGADACLIVGADWSLINPGLIDRTIDRFREGHKLAFAQAPPGLAGCILSRSIVEDLASSELGAHATIGGLLGYQPLAPRSDPIARSECIAAEPPVRDLGLRCIPDAEPLRRMLERTDPGADLAALASALAAHADRNPDPLPPHITLELCTGRMTSGLRGRWLRGEGEHAERPILDPALAHRLFREIARVRSDACITFAGAGDPLLHPDGLDLIAAAKEAGIASVHLRTDLLAPTAASLVGSPADVISVDLMAEDAATYRRIMGVDRFADARQNLERLIAARSGLRPWIVPRMTRCEAALPGMERFYDRWLLASGACVIDPHPWGPADPPGSPPAAAEERIRALARPRTVQWREAGRTMTIWSDGSVTHPRSDRRIGSVDREPLADVWERLWKVRRDTISREKAS